MRRPSCHSDTTMPEIGIPVASASHNHTQVKHDGWYVATWRACWLHGRGKLRTDANTINRQKTTVGRGTNACTKTSPYHYCCVVRTFLKKRVTLLMHQSIALSSPVLFHPRMLHGWSYIEESRVYGMALLNNCRLRGKF